MKSELRFLCRHQALEKLPGPRTGFIVIHGVLKEVILQGGEQSGVRSLQAEVVGKGGRGPFVTADG